MARDAVPAGDHRELNQEQHCGLAQTGLSGRCQRAEGHQNRPAAKASSLDAESAVQRADTALLECSAKLQAKLLFSSTRSRSVTKRCSCRVQVLSVSKLRNRKQRRQQRTLLGGANTSGFGRWGSQGSSVEQAGSSGTLEVSLLHVAICATELPDASDRTAASFQTGAVCRQLQSTMVLFKGVRSAQHDQARNPDHLGSVVELRSTLYYANHGCKHFTHILADAFYRQKCSL
jgi:hypothetical protein